MAEGKILIHGYTVLYQYVIGIANILLIMDI